MAVNTLKSRLTMALVVLNVGVYLVDHFATGIELWATLGDDFVRVADGDYHRWITGAFVHAGFTHLASNLLLLVTLGPTVEAGLGRWRFGVLYVVAALSASVSVFLVGPADGILVGSSGAVYAVMAAWALTMHGGDRFTKAGAALVWAVMLWAATVQLPLENLGHAAGAVIGVSLVLAWRRSWRWRWPSAGDAVAVGMVAVLVTVGLLRAAHLRSLAPWSDSPGSTIAASEGRGGPSRADAFDASLSADGRLVAFTSYASDLVPGDDNGVADAFIRDLTADTMVRASVGAGGIQANGDSFCPTLSADGRFVVFRSKATNLASVGGGGGSQLFVRDLSTGSTERLGAPSPEGRSAGCASMSADGRFVAFLSGPVDVQVRAPRGPVDLFVHDRSTNATSRVAAVGTVAATEHVLWSRPMLSADGRFVAFVSDVADLVRDDTNGESDVFVHDRQRGRTTRVSVTDDGTQGLGFCEAPSLSADGRYVAFRSLSNLVGRDSGESVDVFVHDRLTGRTSLERPAHGQAGFPQRPALSSDGRYVAFQIPGTDSPTRRNETVMIDRSTGVTSRISVGFRANYGGLSNSAPSFSADGRFVAFESGVEEGARTIFVHDRQRSG